MKNKKLLSIILVLVLALTAMPMTTAFAATTDINLGVGITATLDTSTGVLTISGTGNIANAVPTEYKAAIKKANIGNGITGISATGLFQSCTNLETVTFPTTGFINTGFQTFFACSKLNNVSLPSSLTQIDMSTFSNCSGLTAIAIPAGVTAIGSTTFMYCTNLADVSLPNNLKSIGTNAFNAFFRKLRVQSIRNINPPVSRVETRTYRKNITFQIKC